MVDQLEKKKRLTFFQTNFIWMGRGEVGVGVMVSVVSVVSV